MSQSVIGKAATFCIICSVLVSCREVTPGLKDEIERDWAQEDTAELCHYFYWPISDPTASQELKVLHYSIMKAELDERGVNCRTKYPDNNMFRLRNMLEKTLG
jgi:hypothetical protein